MPLAPTNFQRARVRAKLSRIAPATAQGPGLRRWANEVSRLPNEKGKEMTTFNPEPGSQLPPSVDRIAVLFPTEDAPPAAPLRAGYGRCGVSGCNCPEYGGQADLCSNCGHNYSSHW